MAVGSAKTDPTAHNSPSECDDDGDFAFQLLGVEAARARRFEVRHAHPEAPKGSIGGHLRYSFTPTGMGAVARVRCGICKRSRDLTDYDSW